MITRFGPGGCYCCGCIAWIGYRSDPLNPRCHHHLDRNPCAIEGCKKTAAAGGRLASDQVMCGEHWRRFAPVGSRARRAYLAHRRRAKRHGWTDASYAAFIRLWDTIVARARRMSTEGTIDEKAIAELFGWDLD